MNQTLTDLVLDASTVATLCADTPGNNLGPALERLCVQGVRLWLYSGEIHDTLTRVQKEMQTAEPAKSMTMSAAHQCLDQKLPRFQWLAALSQDM